MAGAADSMTEGSSVPGSSVPDLAGFPEHISLVRAEVLPSLPVPWPRSQDLPAEFFASPQKEDLVLAVSHGWQYQVHPDPHGETCMPIRQLVGEAEAMHRPLGRTVLFYDFLSAPQRAFAQGQAERTAKEQACFAEALREFPHIYLHADATIHIESACDMLPADGETYEVDIRALESTELTDFGGCVQVACGPRRPGSDDAVLPFDIVEAVGTKRVTSLRDVAKLQESRRGGHTSWSELWGCATPACGRRGAAVTMRRAPYGRRNTVPTSQKGWVYLERVVSMVKAAMVPESQARSVAFSNSPAVLHQILEGGRRLRAAAEAGPQELQGVLRELACELDSKQFSATSIDKAQNTGGVGGTESPRGAAPSDREVVLALMRELVNHLASHWERERAAQQRRQLALAVGRGDAPAVRELLAHGADPNAADNFGVTSLHVAAKSRQLEVARILIAAGADRGNADVLGNTPAHMVPLLYDSSTVPMLRLLAPAESDLTVRNHAGITPLHRFHVWADVELAGRPLPEASAFLESLRTSSPRAFDGTARRGSKTWKLPPVRETETVYTVAGRDVRTHAFEPLSGDDPGVDVLCLSLSFFVPPALGAAAVRTVAQHVSCRKAVRFFCLGVDGLSPASIATGSLAAVHEELLQIIEALPLRRPYLLLDSGLGEATPLLWKLADDLSAAVVVNPRGFHSDEFKASDLCPELVRRVEQTGRLFAQRDVEQLAAMWGDYAFAGSPWEIRERIETYRAALKEAPPIFFEHGEFQCRMLACDAMQQTRIYKTLGALDGPQVAIACGAFSPGFWTLETAPRLRALIKGSFVANIPDDKSCWELEGPDQAWSVAQILLQLMESTSAGTVARPVARVQTAPASRQEGRQALQASGEPRQSEWPVARRPRRRLSL